LRLLQASQKMKEQRAAASQQRLQQRAAHLTKQDQQVQQNN
jgi:hypothetical protein